jgi:hypothetical protein
MSRSRTLAIAASKPSRVHVYSPSATGANRALRPLGRQPKINKNPTRLHRDDLSARHHA